MKLLLPAILAALLPCAAFAQSVFPAMTGMSVAGGKGAATPSPNYTIHQWGIPAANKFTGFVPFWTAWATSGPNGWVIEQGGKFLMQADGSNLACTAIQNGKSQVVEYDLQAVPPAAKPEPALSTLHHAILSGTVSMSVAMGTGTPCPTTMTSVGDNLILKNTKTGGVFFFQERLGGMAYKAGALVAFKPANGSWFETGSNQQTGDAAQWGYDDNVTTHGLSYVQNGGTLSYSVDVLPTIESQIAAGAAAYGMDGNLADWVIVSRYSASGNWGPLKTTTGWAGLALELQ